MLDSTFRGKRRAGACLHVSSLPGPHGIGELGMAARSFVDALCRMRLSIWQVLPLGPTAYGNSPYQPLSTFAGNELLVDIGELIAMRLLRNDEVAELRSLPGQYVDFSTLIPIKTRLLDLAARRFGDVASADMLDDLAQFIAANDDNWLHDYARFRVLKSNHGERSWVEWPADFAHRDARALSKLDEQESDRIEAIKIMQYLFFSQWEALREYARANDVLMFGDMPIYIALDSADAWSDPRLLQLGADGQPNYVAGVPPDYFSEDGQLWGNPLYAWDRHAENGYQWWIDRLRAAAQLTDLVRIDHFRGFESYWAVAANAETARHGTWMPGPGDALFSSIRDALGSLPVVAEDLGIITPEVTALRQRHGLPGMRVLQFDVCDPDFNASSIGKDCVCYTGTHDNDTTVGWLQNNRDDAIRFTGGTAETIHTDLIRAAFLTDACIAIAPLQDILGLGSDARINTPGTAEGNWQWRYIESQLTPGICDNIASLVNLSKRGMSTNEQSN